MSRTYSAKKNKHQKQPKVFFEQYLYNAGEPPEHIYSHPLTNLEVELLESSFSMRHRVRRIAQRLRNHNS